VNEVQFDPELLQDFLTESTELLEQLDQDLVLLESTPTDLELLNRVFRALHTIKGSASFLALTNLVAIAHAAETALNAARNRVFVVDRAAMDLMLGASDVLKKQLGDVRAGRELTLASTELVSALSALGEAAPPGRGAPAIQKDAPGSPAEPADKIGGGSTSVPLALPKNKLDLLDFLVADVDQTLEQIDAQLAHLAIEADRMAASASLSDLGEQLAKSAEFFEFGKMQELAGCLIKLGQQSTTLAPDQLPAAMHLGQRVLEVLREQKAGLASGQIVTRPIEALCEPFGHLNTLEAERPASVTEPDRPGAPAEPADAAPGSVQASAGPAAAQGASGGAGAGAGAGEQTIRVEVSRLETLLNLVGELVLQKNRVGALVRGLARNTELPQDVREQFGETSSSLDRVTSDLQVAVMKTRMQPLEKVFGKYPRLIRDLARKLNKQINLEIEGASTEVDKSVIEEIGDPLVHLMRNSADHGVESPADRVKAGKPQAGTIRLVASNAGGHVQILIIDDGKGIDPEFIARKCIEKGLITDQQAAAMSEREKIALIFAPGFSTAEKLSDVSGRGVGMDVVKTNIEKLKGTIEIESVVGQGTTMRIKIPLTVAILSAMMVGVGQEIYAVPLANVIEIVKPGEGTRSSINQRPVMRLRDTVLPLLSSGELFGLGTQAEEQFAVVLSSGDKRVGLLVTRLIGQQEVVIKPLDRFIDKGGPVSGATVRDDGGVSLIVDVQRMFAIAAAGA
jgi:two-component system chemotaxis sensor kinase CheA